MGETTTGSKDELYSFLVEEYNHPFKGWDFSYITGAGRMSEGPRKWSYGSIVRFLVVAKRP